MRRRDYARLGVLGAAAVVVAVASAVGTAGSVLDPGTGPDTQAVERVDLVCPHIGAAAATATTLAVATAPGPGGATAAAGVTATPLAGQAEAAPVLTLDQRGVTAFVAQTPAQPQSYLLVGRQSLAPGLGGVHSTLATGVAAAPGPSPGSTPAPDAGTEVRGLADAACTAPGSEFWFAGASGQVGRQSRLVLANPADVPAVVDLHVWDEVGAVDSPGTQDVTVPARSEVSFLVSALAEGSARVGIQVSAVEGRVAPVILAADSAGIDPNGLSFHTASEAPAERVVVPGVPGAGERLLYVLAPGDSDAIVSIRLLGPDGPFSPTDRDVVQVPSGSVAEIPLGDVTGRDGFAVELTADVPVTASVRVGQAPTAAGRLPDFAWTAAAPLLDSPAVLPLTRVGGGLASSILLTAVDGYGESPGDALDPDAEDPDGSFTEPAESPTEGGGPVTSATESPDGEDEAATAAAFAVAWVTVLAPDGRQLSRERVELIGGSSVVHPVVSADPALTWVTVVVEPDRPGLLVAARLTVGTDARGELIDLVPAFGARTSVPVPDVEHELATVLRPTR